MMQLVDFAVLTHRRIPLERIRLQGRDLGIDLVNKLEEALQFSYTHVTKEGISIRLVIQCIRPDTSDILVPAAPSAFFFFKEDPMILEPRPFLAGSLFQRMASQTIPTEYHGPYQDALRTLDDILSKLETKKEEHYEYIH